MINSLVSIFIHQIVRLGTRKTNVFSHLVHILFSLYCNSTVLTFVSMSMTKVSKTFIEDKQAFSVFKTKLSIELVCTGMVSFGCCPAARTHDPLTLRAKREGHRKNGPKRMLTTGEKQLTCHFSSLFLCTLCLIDLIYVKHIYTGRIK